ncbi:unnamed protein product [Spirodela intermedia]|uniref:BZIP domain-containing protein n=1 Tax=Spirodela intermedia TaxID=51605 RepID=A0A7I8LF84_SPIIN|nr:unnamed protein product [Spirodela intermedia]
MGNDEAATPSKAEKASASVLEQSNVHPYPDWATMQAYYGSGMAMPSPYFGTNVTPAHPPHPYMWAPPTVVIQGTPVKSPHNKVMKGPDELAVSACNASDENESGSVADVMSQSESEVKDSSDGSNKNNVKRDDRELKRQKRKQSNRESARRSRLRKQTETEELAQKIDSLVAENLALKSEVSQLSKDSARLRLENSALEDKLKEAQSVSSSTKTESGNPASAVTENFLSRISNSPSTTRSEPPSAESPGKLRQLLESSSRAGAAVVG